MAKQRLSDKKLHRCENISGRKYRCGYTRGGWPHGEAECWFGEGESVQDADRVNYLTSQWWPTIRNGQIVKDRLAVAISDVRQQIEALRG